jgi:hypothetical protein
MIKNMKYTIITVLLIGLILGFFALVGDSEQNTALVNKGVLNSRDVLNKNKGGVYGTGTYGSGGGKGGSVSFVASTNRATAVMTNAEEDAFHAKYPLLRGLYPKELGFKSGCIDRNACDYDPLATIQGVSCAYAWYQTGKDGDKKPPYSDSNLTPNTLPSPVFSDKPCRGCTDALFLKTRVVFFDGRTPATYESEPYFIRNATPRDAARLSGKNACKALGATGNPVPPKGVDPLAAWNISESMKPVAR